MDLSIQEKIRNLLLNSLNKSFSLGKKDSANLSWDISFPHDLQHGDYASNIALVLAEHFHRPPMDIASLLEKNLDEEKPIWLRKIEVVSPGFINFWLSRDFLEENLKLILSQKNKYGRGKTKKTAVIEYSSPNIAKPFGIGHLRSTIIGQALYNIYQFSGWKCVGLNHLGDWGTQFGKVIVAVRSWVKDRSALTLATLEQLYVRFHQEAEKDPTLNDQARQWFKKLEKGDREALSIWKQCTRLSRKEFQRIYQLLNVRIDYTIGESFYLKKAKKVVQEALAKGLAQKSRGALIINLPKIKTPLLLEKSDGTTIYATRDLAAIKYRFQRWHPQLMIWEVGREQELYFQQCFAAARLLDYAPQTKMVHVAHGLVRWEHGKLSTREGKTIHLEEVLTKAIEKASRLIHDSEGSLTALEKKEIARKVGLGAIKFYDLSHSPGKDIIFNWKEVLNLESNSGPYVQYTIVRGKSVLKKAGRVSSSFEVKDLSQDEENILRALIRFPQVVQEAADRFSPNLIANFASALSQSFNLFYQHSPILKAPVEERSFRLSLTQGVVQVLSICLNLLGIEIPTKM